MSAAEFYGSQPNGGGNGSRIDREPSSRLQHKTSTTSYSQKQEPSFYQQETTPYHSSSDFHDLNQSSQHNGVDTSYHRPQNHHRDSTTSIPSKYPDPYAENIPLNERPTSNQNFSNTSLPPPVPSKKGFFAKGRRRAWFCYVTATVTIIVFIVELVRNQQLTGSVIATKPSFNPMIGPSPYVLINMGSRYTPCMQYIEDIAQHETLFFPCPGTTTEEPSCSLSELCGFGGVPSAEEMRQGKAPNQWFRFIIPMFLHAGLIHIAFNLLLLLLLGAQIEEDIGPLRFALVYFASGIFGFILGGNFAPRMQPSVGASGGLFGILALNLLDLIYTWKERHKPGKELAWLIAELVFTFALGLLPGLDNFAHIGGFLMGILLGICLLRSPNQLRERIGVDDPPYTPVTMSARKSRVQPNSEFTGGMKQFVKNPVGFFKGRKPLWWAWWLVRAGALVGAIVAAVVLLNNFYVNRKDCEWCQYLSCLPIKDWCEIGDLKIEETKEPLMRL